MITLSGNWNRYRNPEWHPAANVTETYTEWFSVFRGKYANRALENLFWYYSQKR